MQLCFEGKTRLCPKHRQLIRHPTSRYSMLHVVLKCIIIRALRPVHVNDANFDPGPEASHLKPLACIDGPNTLEGSTPQHYPTRKKGGKREKRKGKTAPSVSACTWLHPCTSDAKTSAALVFLILMLMLP